MQNRRVTRRSIYEVEKELKNTQFEICYHHCCILQQQIFCPVTADCRVAKTRKKQPAQISVTNDDGPSSTICLIVNESNNYEIESMISIVANTHQQQPSPLSTTTTSSLLPQDGTEKDCSSSSSLLQSPTRTTHRPLFPPNVMHDKPPMKKVSYELRSSKKYLIRLEKYIWVA